VFHTSIDTANESLSISSRKTFVMPFWRRQLEVLESRSLSPVPTAIGRTPEKEKDTSSAVAVTAGDGHAFAQIDGHSVQANDATTTGIWARLVRALEVKQPAGSFGSSVLTNETLLPVPTERRTWTKWTCESSNHQALVRIRETQTNRATRHSLLVRRMCKRDILDCCLNRR
jgi:hypothetical protein